MAIALWTTPPTPVPFAIYIHLITLTPGRPGTIENQTSVAGERSHFQSRTHGPSALYTRGLPSTVALGVPGSGCFCEVSAAGPSLEAHIFILKIWVNAREIVGRNSPSSRESIGRRTFVWLLGDGVWFNEWSARVGHSLETWIYICGAIVVYTVHQYCQRRWCLTDQRHYY